MFTINQYLPVFDGNVRYSELLNQHMLIINKFITNSDDTGLFDYFEQLIQELLIDKTVYTKLYNVDKFLMLLNIRSICIGNEIKFNSISNQSTLSVHLHTIINKYTNPISNFEQSISIDNMYQLVLNIPKMLYLTGFDSVMTQVIDKIVDNNETYYMDTIEQKNEILKIIPANKTQKIIEYINTMSEQGDKFNIMHKIDKINTEKISMNPFNNNMCYFIKNIFSEKLYDVYQLYFNMINLLKFDYNSIINQTPAESYMYITLFDENRKKQNQSPENPTENIPQL